MATKKTPVTFDNLPEVDYNGFDNWINNQNTNQLGQQAYQNAQGEAMVNGILPRGGDTVGNDIWGSMKDAADAGFFSSLAGTARFAGEFAPAGNEALNNIADYLDQRAAYNTPTEELTGANYVAGAIGNAIGSGGAAMAQAAVVAGIGKVLGLTTVGSATLGVISKTPGLRTLYGAAKSMWQKPFGKMLIGQVAGSPFEATAEAGNLITEMRNEGYDDETIREAALTSAGYNMAWLTVANMLEAGAEAKIASGFAKTLGKGEAGKFMTSPIGLKEGAKRVGQVMGFGALSEGGEEFGQNLIGNYAKGEDFNYADAREAALQGAIGGAFLGGAGVGANIFLGDDSRNFNMNGKHFEAGNSFMLGDQKVRDYKIDGKDVSAAQFFAEAGLQEEDGNTYGVDRQGYSKAIVEQEINALDDSDPAQAKQKETLSRIVKSNDTEKIWQAAKAIYKKGPHFDVSPIEESSETEEQINQEEQAQTENDAINQEMLQTEQSYGDNPDIVPMDVNSPVWGERVAQQQSPNNNFYGNRYARRVSGEQSQNNQRIRNNNIGNIQSKPQTPFMPNEYYTGLVDNLAGRQQDKTNSITNKQGNDFRGDSSKLDNLIRRAYHGDSNASWQLYNSGVDENYIKAREQELKAEDEARKARWEQRRLNGEEYVAPAQQGSQSTTTQGQPVSVATPVNKPVTPVPTQQPQTPKPPVQQPAPAPAPVQQTGNSNGAQSVVNALGLKPKPIKQQPATTVQQQATTPQQPTQATPPSSSTPTTTNTVKTPSKQQQVLKSLMDKEKELKDKVTKGAMTPKEAKRQFTMALDNAGNVLNQTQYKARKDAFGKAVDKIANKNNPVPQATTPTQTTSQPVDNSNSTTPVQITTTSANQSTNVNNNSVKVQTPAVNNNQQNTNNTQGQNATPTTTGTTTGNNATDKKVEEKRENLRKFYKMVISMIKNTGVEVITNPKSVLEHFNKDVAVHNSKIHSIKLESGRVVYKIGNSSYAWYGEFLPAENQIIIPAISEKNGKLDGAMLGAPIHEFTHLWVAVLKKRNNKLWEQGKKLLERTINSSLTDPATLLVKKNIKKLEDRVRQDGSPYSKYIDKEGNYTDAFWDEVLARCLGDQDFTTLAMTNLGYNKNERDTISAWKQWIAKAWKEIKHAFRLKGQEIHEVKLSEFLNMPLADLINGQLIGEMNGTFGSSVKLKTNGTDSSQTVKLAKDAKEGETPKGYLETKVGEFRKLGEIDEKKYSNYKSQLNRRVTEWQKKDIITEEEAKKLHAYVDKAMPSAFSDNAKKSLTAEQQKFFDAGEEIAKKYGNKEITWEQAEEQILALFEIAKDSGVKGRPLDVLKRVTWAKYYSNQTIEDKTAKEKKIAEYKANKNAQQANAQSNNPTEEAPSTNAVVTEDAQNVLNQMFGNKQPAEATSSQITAENKQEFNRVVNEIKNLVEQHEKANDENVSKELKDEANRIADDALMMHSITEMQYNRIVDRINVAFMPKQQQQQEQQAGMAPGASNILQNLGLQQSSNNNQNQNQNQNENENIEDVDEDSNVDNGPSAVESVQAILNSIPTPTETPNEQQQENNEQEISNENTPTEKEEAPKDAGARWMRLNKHFNEKLPNFNEGSKAKVLSWVTKPNIKLYEEKTNRGTKYYVEYDSVDEKGNNTRTREELKQNEADLLSYGTGEEIQELAKKPIKNTTNQEKEQAVTTKETEQPKKAINIPSSDEDNADMDFADEWDGREDNEGVSGDDILTALEGFTNDRNQNLEKAIRREVASAIPKGKVYDYSNWPFAKLIDTYSRPNKDYEKKFEDYNNTKQNIHTIAYDYYKFLYNKYAKDYRDGKLTESEEQQPRALITTLEDGSEEEILDALGGEYTVVDIDGGDVVGIKREGEYIYFKNNEYVYSDGRQAFLPKYEKFLLDLVKENHTFNRSRLAEYLKSNKDILPKKMQNDSAIWNYAERFSKNIKPIYKTDAPMRLLHNSPYWFDNFSWDFIGKGEGYQAHGMGFYAMADTPYQRPWGRKQYRDSLINIIAGEKYKVVLDGIEYIAEIDDDSFVLSQPNSKGYDYAGIATNEHELALEIATEALFNCDGDIDVAASRITWDKSWRLKEMENTGAKEDDVARPGDGPEPDFTYKEVFDAYDKAYGMLQNASFEEIKSDRPPGMTKEMTGPAANEYLDEDDEFSEQPNVVKKALEEFEYSSTNVTTKIVKEDLDNFVYNICQHAFDENKNNIVCRLFPQQQIQKVISRELYNYTTQEISDESLMSKICMETDRAIYNLCMSKPASVWTKEVSEYLPKDLDINNPVSVGDYFYEHIVKFVKSVNSKIESIWGRYFDTTKRVLSLAEDAANRQLTGEEIYKIISRKLGSKIAASHWLDEHGVKGITYDGRMDGRCFVFFNDNAVKTNKQYELAIKKNKDEILKSRQELIDAALDCYPKGTKVEQYDNNKLLITTPNGLQRVLDIRNQQIILNAKEAEGARQAHGVKGEGEAVALGYEQTVIDKDGVKELIALGQGADEHTIWHENGHALMKDAFTASELKTISKHLATYKRMFNKKGNEQELFADALADRKIRSNTVLGRLINKFQTYLGKLEALLTGTENFYDVLDRVVSKEIYKRDIGNNVRNENQGKQYQTATLTLDERAAGVTVDSAGVTALQKITDVAKDPTGYLAKWWKDFYIDWVDKNHMFKEIDKLHAKIKGKPLENSEKIYGRAQGIASTSNGVTDVLMDGTKQDLAALNKRLLNVKLKHADGTMRQVLEPLKEGKLDTKSKAFMKKYKCKNSAEALGKVLTWRRLREMYKAQKTVPDYKVPSDLTEAELNTLIKGVPKQFMEACERYYHMNDNILCILEDSGVISKELHDLLNTTYKEYCPLQRDFSESQGIEDYLAGFHSGGNGPANVNNLIKKIGKEGSDRKVLNPLETTTMTAMMASRRAERNKVAQQLVKLADVKGMENVVEERFHWGTKGKEKGKKVYDTADPKKSTFTVMFNGEKRTYHTAPEFYEAVVGYNDATSGILWDTMSMFSKFVREGATLSPSFIVRNGWKDSLRATYMTNVGFKPIYGSIHGFRSLRAKGDKAKQRVGNTTLTVEEVNALFKALGFGSSTRAKDGRAIYESLKKRVGDDSIDFTNPVSLVKALFKSYKDLNADVELGTRRELFELKIIQDWNDLQKGKITFEQLVQNAAEVARFGTVDFSRSGKKGEKWNQVSAFLNAGIQGVDLFGQGLADPETRNQTLMALGNIYVVPCFCIWLMNHDKDWWKELDPRIKYTNFCVSEDFRMPFDQEGGVMAGGGFLAILDKAMEDDPKAMSAWASSIQSNLLPNPMVNIALPLLEWQANYSWFKDRPIVNQQLAKLKPEKQYDNGTTELSKVVGEIFGVSPKKVDNTVSDMFATLGIQAWDMIGESFSNANRPKKSIGERTFFKDFNITQANRNRYTTDFYDLWSEANAEHSTYGKKGNPTQAVKSINAAQRLISSLQKEIRAIENPENTAISPAQKREMIDAKRKKINEIAKKAVDKYGNAKFV